MSKQIVIIRSNPIRPDSRVEKEACALIDLGYGIHILAWDRDSSHMATEELLELGTYIIPITRLGYKASFGEGMKNLKAYLSFQFGMQNWIYKNRKNIDVIHACDFDTAFFSYFVSRIFEKKFVFDIFDFLFGNPQGLLQKCVKQAQYYLINHADATIICTEARRMQIVGSKPKNLAVIENTPANEIVRVSKTTGNKKNDRLKVVYVGILQDYRLLLEILEYFANEKGVEFHCGGFGKYEDAFIKYARDNDNIFFYGRIPYDKTIQLEESCDIMLAIYDPSIENHRMAAPNKFYESLMLGKPVIMVKGTGMSEEVERNDIGVLIDYSYEGFARGLNQLLERKNEFREIGKRAKELYKTDHSWEKMKERLAILYRSL